MGRKRATPFDPKTFLTKVDGGKKILQCRKKTDRSFRKGMRRTRCSISWEATSSSPCSPAKAKKPSLRF